MLDWKKKMWRVGHKTSIGSVQNFNNDYYFMNKRSGLFIISDGMGKNQIGRAASRIAVETIVDYLKSHNVSKLTSNTTKSRVESELVKNNIKNALLKANKIIYALYLHSHETGDLGATIVLALIVDGYVYVASVGDSRAYLIRNGSIRQITKEDSMVNELIKRGRIVAKEAANHPLRHIVTQVLGQNETLDAKISKFLWQSRDYVVLCTDGLPEKLTSSEIKKVVTSSSNPQVACNRLVQLASNRGEKDDITVVVIHDGDHRSKGLN